MTTTSKSRLGVPLPDVTCPLPEVLDYKRAKATYAQVRKDTNYKLSPEANKREAARRLNVDVETFTRVMTTKVPHVPSPVTVKLTEPSVEVAVDEVVDYKRAKAMYAQVRKDTNFKMTPLNNRIEAARRLNMSLEDFEKVMSSKTPVRTTAAKVAPKAPEPKAITRWSRKTQDATPLEDAKATNPGFYHRERPATTPDDVTPKLESLGIKPSVGHAETRWDGFRWVEGARGTDGYIVRQGSMGSVNIEIIGDSSLDVVERIKKQLTREGWQVRRGFTSSVINVKAPKSVGIPDTVNNCTSCTTTWELRRRGYDVVARQMKKGIPVSDVYNSWNAWSTQLLAAGDKEMVTRLFNGRTFRLPSYITEEQFRVEVIMMPVGARGFIANLWKRGGGHIWNWEVREAAGRKEIWFIDGQSGKEWPLSEDTYLSRSQAARFNVTRVDQLPDPGEAAEHLTSDVVKGQMKYTGR